jgi:hypothetical protein
MGRLQPGASHHPSILAHPPGSPVLGPTAAGGAGPPWGIETIWIGSGARPGFGTADHLLWFDDVGDEAASNGAFVLAYHVLWELTHVCFEHPGLLTQPIPDDECDDAHCTTWSDEGRVAEVVEHSGPFTVVLSGGGTEELDTTLVAPGAAGTVSLATRPSCNSTSIHPSRLVELKAIGPTLERASTVKVDRSALTSNRSG